MLDTLRLALVLAALVAIPCTGFMGLIYVVHAVGRIGRIRVLATVVGHEEVYDETYRRREYLPVIEYEASGGRWRVRLSEGCFSQADPDLSPGTQRDIYVLAASPQDVETVRTPLWTLALGPAVGLFTGLVVFVISLLI
jgi:hypothetical protein